MGQTNLSSFLSDKYDIIAAKREKHMVKISSLLAVHMCRIECGNLLKIQFSLAH